MGNFKMEHSALIENLKENIVIDVSFPGGNIDNNVSRKSQSIILVPPFEYINCTLPLTMFFPLDRSTILDH